MLFWKFEAEFIFLICVHYHWYLKLFWPTLFNYYNIQFIKISVALEVVERCSTTLSGVTNNDSLLTVSVDFQAET